MRPLALCVLALAFAACAHPTMAAPTQPVASGPQAPMLPPAAATGDASLPGPTATDPDKYVVVFENECLRVLRYHDEPGARTGQHRHPDSLLYALSPFQRRLHFPDGSSRERAFRSGDLMWVPAQTHVGENVGQTPTEVLLVEPRQCHRE